MTFYYKLQHIITKYERNLLQDISGFLIQNATVITNCDDFIPKCDTLDVLIHRKQTWPSELFQLKKNKPDQAELTP